jgi:hypothetical protein
MFTPKWAVFGEIFVGYDVLDSDAYDYALGLGVICGRPLWVGSSRSRTGFRVDWMARNRRSAFGHEQSFALLIAMP